MSEGIVTNNQEKKDPEITWHSINLLIDKKIADAKLVVAESRLQFFMKIAAGFVALFGIALPIFLTVQSSSRVDTAIQKVDSAIQNMETKFNELAGKQLRTPEITAYVDGQNLVNHVLRFAVDNRNEVIVIKNTGDGTAEYVTMSLYMTSEDTDFHDMIHFSGFNKLDHSEDAAFKWSYRYAEALPLGGDIPKLPAQDSVLIYVDDYTSGKLKTDVKGTALLKVYYGEPSPKEIPFTIEIKK